uniref:Uncharacterized protein n=1 Tax=Trypanosoma congolense (strain IL3000) TaxID=1068625 RepID=G0UU84_TRYCI|nr:conserved hypothetical protein [Trypanosoma congolense IL3000]
MHHVGVKVLNSRRQEIKERMMHHNASSRRDLRGISLCRLRGQTGEAVRPVADEYAFIGSEFRCDLNDPSVIDLLIQIENEIKTEQIIEMYEASHEEDWEAHYLHLSKA